MQVDVRDALVRSRPRMLARGVADGDLAAVERAAGSWTDWLDAWVRVGDEYAADGRTAEENGRTRTAGEFHLRAALSYHFGKYLWLEDVATYRATTQRSAEAHRRAMGHLDPTFERLEIPFERDRLVANLRRPGTAHRPPYVILVPGLDSTKEEFPLWEKVFLDRGLATIALDGPGQGEAGRINPLRPEYETAVAALLDALTARPDLDHRRIGITGIGVGGFLAARAAAFEPRIGAVAAVGGAYRFDRMPPLVRNKFLFSTDLAAEDARTVAERFTLDGVADRIGQPFLVAYGQGDRVMTAEQARQPARAAPRGRFVAFSGGGTAGQAALHRINPYLADWIVESLGP